MKYALAISLLAASPLIASGQGEANAELTQITGSVLVSNGPEIASATHSIRLSPGMRVLTTPVSSAEVVFDDGCRVHVKPGDRFEVGTQSPCQVVSTIQPGIVATEVRR